MSSTNILSNRLSTLTPLVASGVFIPVAFDDLLEYSGVIINLRASTRVQLTCIESPNKTEISKENVYIVDANESLNIQFNLNSRFFKLRLDNLDNVNNQTYLNLQTIYSNQRVEIVDAGSFKIWDNKAVLANTPSDYYKSNFKNGLFSFYGNSSAATTLTVQMSDDGGVNWYNTQSSYTLASSGNFGFSFSGVCKYIRLINTTNPTTLTCFINYK